MSSPSEVFSVPPETASSLMHALSIFLHRLFYWSVVHFMYGMLLRPVVVWWCEHVRPFPLPGGPVSSSRGSLLGEVCDVGGRGLVSLLCGATVAHNEHLGLLVHPCEVLPAVDGDEDEGRRVGYAGFPWMETRPNGLRVRHHRPFASLDEAVAYAADKGQLLAVLVHSELNKASRSLVAEIIGRDTCDVQRYLRESIAFYLVSALGPECGDLNGLQGVSLPAVVVYAPRALPGAVESMELPPAQQQLVAAEAVPNPREAARAAAMRRVAATRVNREREEGAATSPTRVTDAAAAAMVLGGGAVQWRRYTLPGRVPWCVPFVASSEGVASVADLLGFLRECDKTYAEW